MDTIRDKLHITDTKTFGVENHTWKLIGKVALVATLAIATLALAVGTLGGAGIVAAVLEGMIVVATWKTVLGVVTTLGFAALTALFGAGTLAAAYAVKNHDNVEMQSILR